MSNFRIMLDDHIYKVSQNLNKVRDYINVSYACHDRDKIDNPYIKAVYDEHFEKLKQIPWGTPEYKAYEVEHFSRVHLMHAQQPHHFNDYRSRYDTPNLMDVIELVADIKASYDEYEPIENQNVDVLIGRIMTRLVERPFTMEDYVRNTLEIMYSECNDDTHRRDLELQERINR